MVMTTLFDGGKSLDEDGPFTAISTFSGRVFDYEDEDTWKFLILDIAHALSNTARFGGHTYFYSVAEHSIRVAVHLQTRGHDVHTQLLGLLHDATEAYIGDWPRPLKKMMHIAFTSDVGPWAAGTQTTIEKYENYLAHSLFKQFGLMDENFEERWKAVKQADYAVYLMEREERPRPRIQRQSAEKTSLNPDHGFTAFMAKYRLLRDKLNSAR